MSGEMYALIATLALAVSNILVKPVAADYHFLSLNAIRTLAGAVAVWVAFLVLARFSGLVEYPITDILGIIGSGFLGIGLGDSLYYLSLSKLDIAPAYTVSQTTFPAFAAVIAFIFLGERLSAMEQLGMAAVLIGVFLVTWRGQRARAHSSRGLQRVGFILVLGAAATWGCSVALTRRFLGDHDPFVAVAVRMTVVALVLLTVARWRVGPTYMRPPPGRSHWLLPWVGGALNALAYVLVYFGLQHSGVAKTSVIVGLAPVALIIMAVLFLKERVTFVFFVGTALAIGGVALLAT